MGWRASTTDDLVMVAFVRHGPHTNKQLQDRINTRYFEEWLRIYGPGWPDSYYGEIEREDGRTTRRGIVRGAAPVGYTDLYTRIRKLSGRGLLIRAGALETSVPGSRAGAHIWRAVTHAELAGRARTQLERLVVPDDLREQAAAAAEKIGCTVSFQVDEKRGYICMRTPRGPVVVDGPPEQSWWDAAIDLGLA